MQLEKNYFFKDGISLEVLNNYLNKAVNYRLSFDDDKMFEEGIRFITNVGAKYICRSFGQWGAARFSKEFIEKVSNCLDTAHNTDPDIIFEAAIFETTTPLINEIEIPCFVFEAFNLPYEKRNFDTMKCRFPDGKTGVNEWGEGWHTPDITQLEHQMFVYYRASQLIDMGFEALHLGQTLKMARNDTDFACWTKVVEMIRDYAKTHARRGYVIINSHDEYKLKSCKTGAFLGDFLMSPIFPHAEENETEWYLPSEDKAQKCIIEANYWGKVPFKANIGGTSPSGWETEHYPYLLELDHSCGTLGGIHNLGNPRSFSWGLDDHSWYCNQPRWYRKEFMEYLFDSIDSANENGHASFTCHRVGYYSVKTHKNELFFANSTKYLEYGSNDEEWIKEILSKR